MPAPKKDKDALRQSLDVAWDLAADAQQRLGDGSTAADVAAVAQAWAAIAQATKAVLH